MISCKHVGKTSWWIHDREGLPLSRVCADCLIPRLQTFKPEILTGEHRKILGLPEEAELSYREVVEEPIDEDC